MGLVFTRHSHSDRVAEALSRIGTLHMQFPTTKEPTLVITFDLYNALAYNMAENTGTEII